MSTQEIKEQLATLPRKEQDEVAAFLFHLRHKGDEAYEGEVERRLDDSAQESWLSIDDFETALDRKGSV